VESIVEIFFFLVLEGRSDHVKSTRPSPKHLTDKDWDRMIREELAKKKGIVRSLFMDFL
jgi:hypothetical protein